MGAIDYRPSSIQTVLPFIMPIIWRLLHSEGTFGDLLLQSHIGLENSYEIGGNRTP